MNRLRWWPHQLDRVDLPFRCLDLGRHLDSVAAGRFAAGLGYGAVDVLSPCPRSVDAIEGDSTTQALRALKQRLARVVVSLVRPTATAAPACLPAWAG